MTGPRSVHDSPIVQRAMRESIAASYTEPHCAALCGTPMDPVLIEQGWKYHPACEPDSKITPWTEAESLSIMRARNRLFYVENGAYVLDRRGNPLPTPRCPPGASMKLWLPRGARQRGEAAARRERADVERRPEGRPQTQSGHNDRAAQMRAALDSLPKAGTRRRAVYDAIAGAGRTGLTHSELSEATGRDYSANGPRVRELVQDGHVMRAPRMREGANGSMQEVWVATINVPEHANPTERTDHAEPRTAR